VLTPPAIAPAAPSANDPAAGESIGSAVISFFNGVDAGDMPVVAFGLDNLAFTAAEPGSFFGLGVGLLAMGLMKRRRLARNRAK
jgi:hypothetical protein